MRALNNETAKRWQKKKEAENERLAKGEGANE